MPLLLPGLMTHSVERRCWLVLPDWVFFTYILKPVYGAFYSGFCLKSGTDLNKDELGERVVHSNVHQTPRSVHVRPKRERSHKIIAQ